MDYHLNDQVLISDYLKELVLHPELDGVNEIYKVNLYGSSPDELTAAHREQYENRWYFFAERHRNHRNRNRLARVAGNGYWIQTNIVQHIFRAGENNERVKIGAKISLDYYSTSNSRDAGLYTGWKMIEYRLDGENLSDRTEVSEWRLCRLYKTRSAKTAHNNIQANLQAGV